MLYSHLTQTLKLASICLPSLSHLPKLPHLQDLHVPCNSLTSVEDTHTCFLSVEFLNLKDNLLETVQALAPLRKWVELAELEVEGNTFCSKSGNYRADVSEILPKIEMLDGVRLYFPQSWHLKKFVRCYTIIFCHLGILVNWYCRGDQSSTLNATPDPIHCWPQPETSGEAAVGGRDTATELQQ